MAFNIAVCIKKLNRNKVNHGSPIAIKATYVFNPGAFKWEQVVLGDLTGRKTAPAPATVRNNEVIASEVDSIGCRKMDLGSYIDFWFQYSIHSPSHRSPGRRGKRAIWSPPSWPSDSIPKLQETRALISMEILHLTTFITYCGPDQKTRSNKNVQASWIFTTTDKSKLLRHKKMPFGSKQTYRKPCIYLDRRGIVPENREGNSL